MTGLADISNFDDEKMVPHQPVDLDDIIVQRTDEWPDRDPGIPQRIPLKEVLGDRLPLPPSVPEYIFEGQPLRFLADPVVCKIGGFGNGTCILLILGDGKFD